MGDIKKKKKKLLGFLSRVCYFLENIIRPLDFKISSEVQLFLRIRLYKKNLPLHDNTGVILGIITISFRPSLYATARWHISLDDKTHDVPYRKIRLIPCACKFFFLREFTNVVHDKR